MDADVAVYNFNPDKPVADPDDIETAFSRCAAVFKSGVQVVQDGEIISTGHKRTPGSMRRSTTTRRSCATSLKSLSSTTV